MWVTIRVGSRRRTGARGRGVLEARGGSRFVGCSRMWLGGTAIRPELWRSGNETAGIELSFDLDRIEEAAKRIGDRQKSVVAEDSLCECDRLGRSLDDECLYTNPCEFVLRNPRNSRASTTDDLCRLPVSASELLALVEVVRAAGNERRAWRKVTNKRGHSSLDARAYDQARTRLDAALEAFGDAA